MKEIITIDNDVDNKSKIKMKPNLRGYAKQSKHLRSFSAPSCISPLSDLSIPPPLGLLSLSRGKFC